MSFHVFFNNQCGNIKFHALNYYFLNDNSYTSTNQCIQKYIIREKNINKEEKQIHVKRFEQTAVCTKQIYIRVWKRDFKYTENKRSRSTPKETV